MSIISTLFKAGLVKKGVDLARKYLHNKNKDEYQTTRPHKEKAGPVKGPA